MGNEAMGKPEAPRENLESLVERTRGLQPWRRLFHATNGLVITGVLLFSPLDASLVIRILGAILGVMLILDIVRLLVPGMNRLFFRTFIRLASPRERGRPASSTWYVLGALLTLLFFPVHIAAPAILVLALADPGASLLGRAFGTRRVGKGTVEGSSAFFAIASLSLLPFFPWPQALGAALLVAAVEIIPWPLDDNLVVPVASGGILALLERIFLVSL